MGEEVGGERGRKGEVTHMQSRAGQSSACLLKDKANTVQRTDTDLGTLPVKQLVCEADRLQTRGKHKIAVSTWLSCSTHRASQGRNCRLTRYGSLAGSAGCIRTPL